MGQEDMKRCEEILSQLSDAVYAMDEQEVDRLAREVLSRGCDAYTAIADGLAAGMNRAGEAYGRGDYFVPELLLCADALYAGLDVLRPHVPEREEAVHGKVIIGVVEGDIHDIGKNLVKTMLVAQGWDVTDLGKDVKVQRFAEKQEEMKAGLVAISALMTTSMAAIPIIIDLVKSRAAGVKTLVGGAPLSAHTAQQFGADGYGKNAMEATRVTAELLESG